MLDEVEKWWQKAKAIKNIKHIDKTNRTHGRIVQALGSKRGSFLHKIEVPIEQDSEIIGWKALCKNEVHSSDIIEPNMKHL